MTYRVPSMEDIAGAPLNGLRVASLFAGCGGSSLGYRMAGFRVVYANEVDEHARQTYAMNAAAWTELDPTDVRDVTGDRILDAARSEGAEELDVLDGSPPCQDFSMAGQRRMDGDNAELFYEFNRLVGEVRPRAFVAENVRGLTQGIARGHLQRILVQLKDAGYEVRRHLLDSSRLGVPQARKRLIIIGFREDLGIDPRLGFPRPAQRQTVLNDALPHVGHFAPAPTMTTGGLRDGFKIRENGHATARPLNLEELKRVSSFPADFRMEGTAAQQKRRLGNSVPPLMARAWAERIADALSGADARLRPRREEPSTL